MFYTYKNCQVVLDGREYVASNLSFSLSSTSLPLYHANRKYSHYYIPSDPVEGTMQFTYFLTGEDHFSDIVYRETEPVNGNFGQISFPSGYLTSYRIRAGPNRSAQASVSIKFFDYEGQLGSGTFTPNTSKPSQDAKVLNFLDATINGTGIADGNSFVTEASFSYQVNVEPTYTFSTGTGLTNLKPDGVTFGPKKLSTSVTVDNLTGGLSMYGDIVVLGLGLRHSDSLEHIAYFESRGYAQTKALQADNQSYAKNVIEVVQDAPSMLALITGGGPTGAAVGETVDVSGINFLSYPEVWIGDYELAEAVYVSDYLLQFTVPNPPPAQGAVNLRNGAYSSVSYNVFESVAAQISITRIEG
jgi:hypothetical protein